MRSRATLAVWLLAALVVGSGSGAAAATSAEHKPGPTATRGGSPSKSAALANKPRTTKRPLRRVPEVSRRPVTATVTTISPAPHLAVVAPPAGSPRPERTAASAAARPIVEARIAAAREVYQAGRYAEVPTALVKLLSESQLTPTQLAGVYELLASAYVALGQTDLAIRCFTEVLNRRPAFALDPVRTSPKIRAALEQAQAQVKPSVPGSPTLPAMRRPM